MESKVKLRIVPKFSKEDFLREVWTTLAQEDAPIALFKKDFGNVEIEEYEVLIDTISADVSYHASIGYNRKEHYIDYEKDGPVTKYNIVTDWSIFSDSREVNNTTAYATNKNYSDFDLDMFRKVYAQLTNSEFAAISGTEAMMFNVSSAAKVKVEKKHSSAIKRSVANSLPGDCYRDLDFTYSVVEQTSVLCKVPMYKASIEYNGRQYIKKAFPFGDELVICGDKVENEQSFEAVKYQTKKTLLDKAEKRRTDVGKYVWEKTGIVEIISMILLLSSVCISILACILKTSVLHNVVVIGITFGVSVAFFAFNFILDKLVGNKERRKAELDIQKDKNEADTKLAYFKENHNTELNQALKNKCNSLAVQGTSKSEL